jgi:hypothetical protein
MADLNHKGPMTDNLGPLQAPRRGGQEPFHDGRTSLGFELGDFWAWSVSDLVSNATRGRLAEYIIARALGISTACGSGSDTKVQTLARRE